MATQAGASTADISNIINMHIDSFNQRRARDIPHPDKGALWATVPGDVTRGDILKFRFYPTVLPIELSRNVASESIAGRALPVFQDLGGAGVKFTVELLFTDAWMTFTLDQPDYTTAKQAKTWFDMYCVGHDGSGISIPLVYFYYQHGHSPPVRVVIHSVKLNTEFFDKFDNPMQMNVTVEMSVFEPVEYVSPFRPKVPPTVAPPPKAKPKPKSNQCITESEIVCTCPGGNAGVVSIRGTAEEVANMSVEDPATTASLGPKQPPVSSSKAVASEGSVFNPDAILTKYRKEYQGHAINPSDYNPRGRKFVQRMEAEAEYRAQSARAVMSIKGAM